MSGRFVLPVVRHVRWQRVGRVGVEVGAQVVRRHAIAECFGNGNDDIGRRNFDLDVVQPTPDMDLADLRPRYLFADDPRQMRLTSGQLDCFF